VTTSAMAVDSFDAATAANAVGYVSPTQFSREYRRLYGRPPRRDVQALRGAPVPGEYVDR
jgi:transcriptional regulator GlxA family with amidase domain